MFREVKVSYIKKCRKKDCEESEDLHGEQNDTL